MKIAALLFYNTEVYKMEKLRLYEIDADYIKYLYQYDNRVMDDMISGKLPAKKYASTDELFKDLES